MSGPPRKPVELEIIEGSPSRRPVNIGTRDARPVGEPPATLSPSEKVVWHRLADEWAIFLTITDRPAFELLCRMTVETAFLRAHVEEHGRLAVNSRGEAVQSPAYRMLRELEKDLNRAYQSFGGTPTTRSKVPGRTAPHSTARRQGLELLTDGGNS